MPVVSFLSLILLNGCATSTPPPDVPVCVELSALEGWCTYTISNKEFYITDQTPYEGKNWVQWVPQMAMMPPDSYAKVKNWELAICEQEKTCQSSMPLIKKKLKHFEQHWIEN